VRDWLERGTPAELQAGASSSVARRPGVTTTALPELTIKGRSEPTSAEPRWAPSEPFLRLRA